jgi:hypothetical protein
VSVLGLAYVLVPGAVLGWGLVTNTYAGRLDGHGYLLDASGLGGKTGDRASADLGPRRLPRRAARHPGPPSVGRPGPGDTLPVSEPAPQPEGWLVVVDPSGDDDHERALRIMGPYAPLVEITTTDEVLAGR